MSRALLIVLLATSAGGCAHVRGVGTKTVADKQPPNRLVAVDASECVVSERKYERVEIGRGVFCLWSDPAGVTHGPTPRAPGRPRPTPTAGE